MPIYYAIPSICAFLFSLCTSHIQDFYKTQYPVCSVQIPHDTFFSLYGTTCSKLNCIESTFTHVLYCDFDNIYGEHLIFSVCLSLCLHNTVESFLIIKTEILYRMCKRPLYSTTFIKGCEKLDIDVECHLWCVPTGQGVYVRVCMCMQCSR